MIKCLLTEFRLGRKEKYLALGHGAGTSLRSVRSGPPTPSISTYYFLWELNFLSIRISVQHNTVILIFNNENINY